jgi:subtilisin family serine protease
VASIRIAFSICLFALASASPAHGGPDAPRIVMMLEPAPRYAERDAWSRAFVARVRAAGLVLRDTLAVPRVPWSLRVVRADVAPLAMRQMNAEPGAALDATTIARRIEADPAVAWAEPDLPREAMRVVDEALPPEPLLTDTRQWGLFNAGPGGAYGGVARADIHAPEAWRLARDRRAPPALLAVADTGIDPAHPEFADPRTGLPRIAHARALADPSGSIHDSLGHGTMVAAIMAAATGEGIHYDSLGMAGVCGECVLAPMRITRGARSTASSFDIAQAILHATAIGARAMNLSFAGGGRSRLERLALTHAITHGTIVVAASGNRGYTAPHMLMYPAAYAADGLCLAVGASDPSDRRPLFASYGTHLDLVAPGLDIWSAWMTYPAATGAAYPGYVAGSGTSFAAPFASGAVGLLAAARPELLPDDFRRLLRLGADDIGAAGPDTETGAGRLNAATSLGALGPGTGIWHDEVAATARRDEATGTLLLDEAGPGAFATRWSGARATQVTFTARVALPDSFTDSVRVWPRVAGTTTLRAGFTHPYHTPSCEARLEGRTIVLSGSAYRLDPDEAVDGTPGEDLWIPLPADQMRFGFTVIGPVRRGAMPPAARARALLRMHPNPARGAVTIDAPAAGRVVVYDVHGRTIWRGGRAGGPGPVSWPGAGADGRTAPPGLYLVAFEGGGMRRTGRLVRID